MFEVRNLCVKRGSTPVVEHLSFSIEAGNILGLVGPNGAGKTTTICALLGLLESTSDAIHLDGKDLRLLSHERRQRFGYVPQSVALYPELTVRNNLKIWSGLYGLSAKIAEGRIDYALELSGLTGRQDSKVSTLSGGMERRLNLSIGLLHDPDVLICDEPTTGVDAESRQTIYNAIIELKAQGKHILYTTHYFHEVETLCDKVVIIQEGKALVESSLSTLLAGNADQATGHKMQFETTYSKEQLAAALEAANIPFEGLKPEAVSLESIYLKLTRHDTGGTS